MRVLLVLANGGPGGMQRQVALLALGLRARGHEVDVAVGGHEAVAGLEEGGVLLRRLRPFRGRSGGVKFLADLSGEVRSFRPDVIHGHGLRLAGALRLVGRSVPVKLVTSHGIDPTSVRSLRLPIRLAGINVAACGEAPRRLLDSIGVDAITLPVGIEGAGPTRSRHDLFVRFNLPEGARVAVSAIRLSDQKDPVTMVRAVALVEGLHLVLFGDGPLLEATRAVVGQLHAQDRVHFAGYDPTARAYFAAGDLVVLSSRWEGHVLVALEAMAAGVPLVATACPGIAEWVDDGSSGLLSEVGDAEALASNMRRVLTNEALARKLGAGGAAIAEQHGIDAMVAAHLRTYGTISGETSPADH